jgi:hypothetical protein
VEERRSRSAKMKRKREDEKGSTRETLERRWYVRDFYNTNK